MPCIDFDIADYLDEASDKELLAELERRKLVPLGSRPLNTIETLRDYIENEKWSEALAFLDRLTDTPGMREAYLRSTYAAACKQRDPVTKQPVVP